MATSGSGTGTPITPIPPAGVGGGGTGTLVTVGCEIDTSLPSDSCLCRHCQPTNAYTSLESWRMTMPCIEPFQFWGWDNGDLRTLRGKTCQEIVYERSGRNMVGRQDVRQALLQAESVFTQELGYSPVRAWFQEQLPPQRLLKTKYPYVIALGAPVRTVLGTATRAAQNVTFLNYTANSGDVLRFSAKIAGQKWPDTFTLTMARPHDLTNADEVCVYIHTDDRYEQKANHARWKIDPIDVTLTSAAITITGRSWLLAKPQLYDVYGTKHPTPTSSLNDLSLDPSHMSNYVERLEIARCTVDQCDAGLVRTKANCECDGCLCAFGDNGAPTHCHTCTEIDLCIDNAKFGHIRPLYPRAALWNLTNSLVCQDEPASVCIHYQAGDCTRDWTRELGILATTYLYGICDCDFPCMKQWMEDRSKGENKQNTFEQLNNPFGTYEGHVAVWKAIEQGKWQGVASW